jgi:hypothetical protein
LFLLFSSLALQADKLVDYLKRYEGRWVGEFTILSTATGYRETLSVDQRYWWDEGVLHGLSVSETKNGLQTAKSLTFIQENQLYSEIIQGETTEYYLGVLHDAGIVWLPADSKRVTDYQMKEFFSEEEGVLRLNTDGFDSYVYQEGMAYLVYRGRLVKQAEVVD